MSNEQTIRRALIERSYDVRTPEEHKRQLEQVCRTALNTVPIVEPHSQPRGLPRPICRCRFSSPFLIAAYIKRVPKRLKTQGLLINMNNATHKSMPQNDAGQEHCNLQISIPGVNKGRAHPHKYSNNKVPGKARYKRTGNTCTHTTGTIQRRLWRHARSLPIAKGKRSLRYSPSNVLALKILHLHRRQDAVHDSCVDNAKWANVAIGNLLLKR